MNGMPVVYRIDFSWSLLRIIVYQALDNMESQFRVGEANHWNSTVPAESHEVFS